MATQKAKENGFLVRPFQFEYRVTAQVERNGKIVDMAAASDKIMEADFNGITLEAIVNRAVEALQNKIANGGGR